MGIWTLFLNSYAFNLFINKVIKGIRYDAKDP